MGELATKHKNKLMLYIEKGTDNQFINDIFLFA